MGRNGKRFDLSIDNPALSVAKSAFDSCIRRAVRKAIETDSMEGSATLKISFQLTDAVDQETGETFFAPVIEYKSGYSVPIKDSIDGIIVHKCRMYKDEDMEGFFNLVSDQVTMEEAMEERT